MVRYYNITLNAAPDLPEFFLLNTGMPAPADPAHVLLDMPLELYTLYRKEE